MPNNKIIDLDRLSRFKYKLDVELEKKANVDGNYPTMTVGAADSLTPYGENSGVNDPTPFVFQSTGGSSDVGSKAYLRESRGNSVAWNQLITFSTGTITSNGITLTKNADKSITLSGTASANAYLVIYSNFPIVVGHTYLFRTNISDVTGVSFGMDGVTTYWGGLGGHIKTLSASQTYVLSIRVLSGTDLSTPITFFPQLIDLTQLGKEYSTVLAFNRDYPLPYYDYNAGTLLSCKTNGIKNVGYNAWDEEWEQGYINANGVPGVAQRLRSKNFTRVVAGQNYSFYCSVLVNFNVFYYDIDENFIGSTTKTNSATNREAIIEIPQNVSYIKFYLSSEYGNGTFYNHDISIHLTWDGSRTGYEEHQEWQYELPNIELRSAGNVYDVLYSTGGGKRRVGVVDLGILTWYYNQDGFLYAELSGIAGTNNLNLTCSKYATGTNVADYTSVDKTIVFYNGYLRIRDSAYTNAATFKTAMSGVMLYYELATETDITTEENPGWQNPQDIDDFGTQEFLYDNDIAIQVPQGNDFFYPVDYKAFIDSLGGREDIEYAADQVVSQEQLQTALSTFLSSISGYDATKTQTLKNVSGVFQWVDD